MKKNKNEKGTRSKPVKKRVQLKLKPSARDNRRYILLERIKSEAVEEAILEYIGILGFAKARYKLVISKDKVHQDKTIASCERSQLHHVKAALTLKGISVLKVASTIKGLSK